MTILENMFLEEGLKIKALVYFNTGSRLLDLDFFIKVGYKSARRE